MSEIGSKLADKWKNWRSGRSTAEPTAASPSVSQPEDIASAAALNTTPPIKNEVKNSGAIASEVLTAMANEESDPKTFKTFEDAVKDLAFGAPVYAQDKNSDGSSNYYIASRNSGYVSINSETKVITYQLKTNSFNHDGSPMEYKVTAEPKRDASRPGQVVYDSYAMHLQMEALKR